MFLTRQALVLTYVRYSSSRQVNFCTYNRKQAGTTAVGRNAIVSSICPSSFRCALHRSHVLCSAHRSAETLSNTPRSFTNLQHACLPCRTHCTSVLCPPCSFFARKLPTNSLYNSCACFPLFRESHSEHRRAGCTRKGGFCWLGKHGDACC